MHQDGGAAFPVLDSNGSFWNPGMSLRDYFAGQALAGFCGNPAIFAANTRSGWTLVNCSDKQLAEHAYTMADVMLAAREAS